MYLIAELVNIRTFQGSVARPIAILWGPKRAKRAPKPRPPSSTTPGLANRTRLWGRAMRPVRPFGLWSRPPNRQCRLSNQDFQPALRTPKSWRDITSTAQFSSQGGPHGLRGGPKCLPRAGCRQPRVTCRYASGRTSCLVQGQDRDALVRNAEEVHLKRCRVPRLRFPVLLESGKRILLFVIDE